MFTLAALTPLLYNIVMLLLGLTIGKVISVEGTLSYRTTYSRKFVNNLLIVTDDRGREHKFRANDLYRVPATGGKVRVYYAWLLNVILNIVSAK
jgi:hypothetical protein